MEKKFELPYGLALDKVFELLEEVKNKPGITENELVMRVGKTYNRAKRAAIELQLLSIQDGRPTLTDIGKSLVWEADKKTKRDMLLRGVVMIYPPYEIAVSRMVKEGKEEITTEAIQQLWATDMGVKLGIGNLSRAVSMMFQMLEFSDLGKYIIGRHGAKTRFVLKEDGLERIRKLQATPSGEIQLAGRQDMFDFLQPRDKQTNVEEVSALGVKEVTSSTDVSPLVRPSWSRLETDFFALKIEKTPEAWDLLETMLPLYRKRLEVDESDEKKGKQREAKHGVNSGE